MKTYLIALIALILLSSSGASALLVNETVKNFQIRFDAIDDANTIAKVWSNDGKFVDGPLNEFPIPANEPTDAVMVLSGNSSDPDDRWGACMILVLKNPENTSEFEKNFIENRTEKYIRVFDRTIDDHKALLLKTGDEPSDPLMTYGAAYWLDEDNGKAAKLVFVVSDWPEKDAGRLMDTIQVKEVI